MLSLDAISRRFSSKLSVWTRAAFDGGVQYIGIFYIPWKRMYVFCIHYVANFGIFQVSIEMEKN